MASDFVRYEARSCIPLGIYADDMEPAVLDLADPYILLVAGEDGKRNRQFLDHVERILRQKEENQILRLNLENYLEELPNLVDNLNERQKNRNEHKREDGFDAKAWLESYMQICILIDDLPGFAQSVTPTERKCLRKVFTRSAELGVIILAGVVREQLADEESLDLVTKAALGAQSGLILEGNPLDYHSFKCREYPLHTDADLEDEEAALIQDGKIRLVRYS